VFHDLAARATDTTNTLQPAEGGARANEPEAPLFLLLSESGA